MTDLATRLGELREPAPASVLDGVLMATGLADVYVRKHSPIGEVFVAAGARGLTAVELATDAARFEADYQARTGRTVLAGSELPSGLDGPVTEALRSGDARGLPFDLRGLSEFGAEVLSKTIEIGPGQVRPYSWVAREIGRPGAARAVGSALRRNPVPVLIPCHRVVRADGSIGQYALGSDRKRQILEAEGADFSGLEEPADRGVA